jgi:enamine deaminase RidA (YjgF/YER057c/UK114 family)
MPDVTHVNPEGMIHNPAFSQAVSVTGLARTVYVGGQNAVEPDGSVASQDVGAQTTATIRNLATVLAAAGARLEDVVSWSILLKDGASLRDGFAAFSTAWPAPAPPPAISVALVAGLADPRFLVEISAVAVVDPSP